MSNGFSLDGLLKLADVICLIELSGLKMRRSEVLYSYLKMNSSVEFVR